MKPPHQHSRINLDELKAQIVKKLGAEGSKQYFYYLHRFLSSKLSKAEFNKLCLRILGREHIPLHNQFIRSILRNACTAKAPSPAVHYKDDVHQQNGSHISTAQASGSPGLSNGGDILPVSPRKARSGPRDRKSGDRRSALGPNGKTGFTPQLSNAAQLSDFNVILENGDLNPLDNIGRPQLQYHQGLIQQAENENMGPTPDGSAPVYSKDHTELIVRSEGKDISVRSPIRAPLGIPFCPVSIGGARRALPPATIGTFCDGALLGSRALKGRMENIALANGLEGVSVDCANVLNHGLDAYMKGLIKSCIEIGGAKSGHESSKNSASHKHHMRMKLINGVKPGHHYQMHEEKVDCSISLQDFRVAMELNPRQLGEDWPLLLEKICTRAFEE